MYITKQDFIKGVCRNGHLVAEGSFTTSHTAQGAAFHKCKQCRNESVQRWKLAHPEAAYRKKLTTDIRHRYGIQSIAERDALLVAQGSACAICGRTGLVWGKGYNDVWHIDHAHDQPGTHRAILCASCNTALGRLEPFLLRVVQYMMKWSPAFEAAIKELVK
jgi:hypothetical protein